MDEAPPSCMTVPISVSSTGDNQVMFIQHSGANGISGGEGRVERGKSTLQRRSAGDVAKWLERLTASPVMHVSWL